MTDTASGAVLPEAHPLRPNTVQGPAGLFDAPSEESRSLRDIVATLQHVPEPLISEPMPDPFVVKL
ncbi:MAG TPA: hypothetical protein VK458_28265, partial [Myxococcaceae bacterium]|nr:hypothetical protein [Myxococcaceae bacterium]